MPNIRKRNPVISFFLGDPHEVGAQMLTSDEVVYRMNETEPRKVEDSPYAKVAGLVLLLQPVKRTKYKIRTPGKARARWV